jgi:hypothetical protein
MNIQICILTLYLIILISYFVQNIVDIRHSISILFPNLYVICRTNGLSADLNRPLNGRGQRPENKLSTS